MSEPDGRKVHSQVRQMGELLEKARLGRAELAAALERLLAMVDGRAPRGRADGPVADAARAALAKARGEG